MPRRPKPWFRLYVETVHDRKLRRMPPARRWVWIAVLAAARSSCEPGVLRVSETEAMDARDIADLASMPVRDVRLALEQMERSGMIHRNGDAWHVTHWKDRQFESDNATQRTRRHRGIEPDPLPFDDLYGDDEETDVGTFQQRP